jgi:hypothetical protein
MLKEPISHFRGGMEAAGVEVFAISGEAPCWSEFGTSQEQQDYIEDWVSKVPDYAIDIVLDVVANPPELDENDFYEWSAQASEILFCWSKRDPNNWLEKIKPFILKEMARPAILAAMSMTSRNDMFICVVSVIDKVNEFSNEERAYLSDVLRSCSEPEAQQIRANLIVQGRLAS